MKKSSKTAIGVGASLVTLGFLFYGNSLINLFNPNPMNEEAVAQNLTTGIQKEDITIGSGATAVSGDRVTVHYIGRLTDGKVFDSSRDRGQPFTFDIGAGQVMRGWEEGLVGMKVGGTRRLIIAPDYGYGSTAIGPIPANSTLVFDVELLGVEKPAK